MEGMSLFCFSVTNPIRKFCYYLSNNSKFDYFILAIILVSTVQLAIENPLQNPESEIRKVLFVVDIITTVIFVLESLIKIIALGMFLNG